MENKVSRQAGRWSCKTDCMTSVCCDGTTASPHVLLVSSLHSPNLQHHLTNQLTGLQRATLPHLTQQRKT